MALHHIRVEDREDDTRVAVSVMGRNIKQRGHGESHWLGDKNELHRVVL